MSRVYEKILRGKCIFFCNKKIQHRKKYFYMNYINMDSINFTANHIKNVNIAKKYYNSYKPCKVALVEMDPMNRKDVEAIGKTVKNWDITFTEFAYEDMIQAREDKELLSQLHVYALTKQKSNYDKMKSSDILGVLELKQRYEDGNKIEALQTKPVFMNDKYYKVPKLKSIGKKLVKYVTKEYKDEPLYVNPARVAIPFYEKLGFKKCMDNNKKNTWCITPKS